jgi:hypothetical protein
LELILCGHANNRYLNYVRQNSPRHIILVLLAGALITCGIDLAALDGIAAGRLAHWAILVVSGALLSALSQIGSLRGLWSSWAAALVLAVSEMGMAVVDFYPGVAIYRSTISPVVELCHNEIDRSIPIVCYGLTHEAKSLAFRLGCRQMQNYDWNEADEAVNALAKAPEIIVLAHTTVVHNLHSRMPPGLTLSELRRHEHVFIGICTVQPSVVSSE